MEDKIKTMLERENEINSIFKLEFERIKPILNNYINKKIYKVDNTLLKKISLELNLNANLYKNCTHIYIKCWNYSINLCIRLRYDNLPNHFEYKEKDFYIGIVINGIFESFNDSEYKQIDINQQIEFYKVALKLKSEYDKARDKCYFLIREFI